MKVNEKNLIAIANAGNLLVDKEGWLNKKGAVNKVFQKRWFVLKGNLLYYFEKKNDKEPVGVVIIEGCTVELADDEDAYSFKIVFHGPGDRSFILCAESQEAMEEWMKALACASYDYMKLMVAELQKQVDELMEMERLKASSSTCKGVNPANPPAVPPRQRHNPFNGSERESGTSKPPVRRQQTFAELHSRYGQKISELRKTWLQKNGDSSEGVLIML